MRTLWTAIVWVTATTLALIGTIVLWPLSPHGKLSSWIVTRHWARAILWSGGIGIDVRGRENTRGGPFVIVCNHSSMVDICACAAALPVDFRFVSRPLFFKLPILGWSMWFARHISLEPKNARAAKRVLKSLGSRFERGISVVLFPEGTRSPDGRIQRYRRGPFVTAIENGVSILPVYLHGVTERLPKGAYRMRPGVIPVVVGEPIPTTALGVADGRRLAEEVETWTRARAAEFDPPHPVRRSAPDGA